MAKTILLENSDNATGDACPSRGSDATFAVVGTFDSASVALEISLDGTNWDEIHDQDGTAIAITESTQDVYATNIHAEYSVRAVISGGGGSTSLTVYMVQ